MESVIYIFLIKEIDICVFFEVVNFESFLVFVLIQIKYSFKIPEVSYFSLKFFLLSQHCL